MGVVGRLKQGDLLIAGEVNERMPVVTNGLVAHFPFDNTEVGIHNRNLLDTADWKIGTSGSQGMFGQNGDGNSIVVRDNPWGNQENAWSMTNNDATSDADGGWNAYSRPIDSGKKYRLSLWVRRENPGDGRTYFGCQGSTVCNLGSTTVNGNPYFYSALANDAPEMIDNWVLWIGYIHPSSYAGGSDPTNGIYKLDGTRTRGFTDYKWEAGETVGGHRAYLYYSTATTERQYFARPRFEICDGSEATIPELIRGQDDSLHSISAASTTLTPNGIVVEEGTTNMASNVHLGFNGSRWAKTTAYPAGLPVEPEQVYRRLSTNTYWGGFTDFIPTSPTPYNRTFTISFWYFLEEGYNGSISSMFTGATASGGSIYASIGTSLSSNFSTAVKGKWLYGQETLKITVDAFSYNYLNGWGGGTIENGRHCYIANFQIEEKAFATSFVNGTRASGMLSLPNTVPVSGDYTVSFRCKLNTTTASTQSYNSIMSMGNYNTNNSWTIMDTDGAKVGGGLGFIRKGNAAEWAWATTSLTPSSDLGKEIAITITKDATNYKCYYNGVLKGTLAHLAGNMQSLLWIGSRENGGHADSTEFKELSIYNRSLSDEEIVKLHGRAFSIQKDGSVISEVDESPVKTLVSYLPLGLNGKDTTRIISPSTDDILIYY